MGNFSVRHDGIALNYDRLRIDLKKGLAAAQLHGAGAIERFDSDAITHDCTPSKLGVLNVVPLALKSSVVDPTLI